jgi:hypothetical protein
MANVPINSNAGPMQYVATGGQTSFAYDFWIEAEEDLDVYVNGTLKTLTTDYTVSQTLDDDGGNVVFNSGLTLNDEVSISLNMDIDRSSGFTGEGGSFTTAVIDREITRFIVIAKQLNVLLSRCLQLGASDSSGISLTIPTPSSNKLLGWNTAGDALENKESTVIGDTVFPDMTGKDLYPILVDESESGIQYGTGTLGALAYKATADTAEIADNAVTLAKMAGGTDGNLITYDANGDPAYVATGTVGQVLTSAGAGAPPTFEDAASSSSVLLSEGSATGQSALNFDSALITSTYKAYLLELLVKPDSTDAKLIARVSTDNGGSIKSGVADYSWGTGNLAGDGGAGTVVTDTSDSEIEMSRFDMDASESPSKYSIVIANPTNASTKTNLGWDGVLDCQSGGNYLIREVGAGRYKTAEAVNYIRLLMDDAGDFSYDYKLYGVL